MNAGRHTSPNEHIAALAGGVVAATFGAALVAHGVIKAIVAVRGGSYVEDIPGTISRIVDGIVAGGDPAEAFGSYATLLPHGTWFYAAIAAPIAIVLGSGFTIWALLRRAARRNRADDGAAWATKRELAPLVVERATPARGILGRTKAGLIATEPNMSTIVLGPAQSGKTSGFCIPRVLEHVGPALVMSVKVDLARNTFRTRAEMGPVWVYDPTNATNLPNRFGWTPLRRCQTWGGARRVAKSLAGATTAKDAGGGNEAAEYFRDRARKLLAPLLYAAALNDLTMTDVVRWIETDQYEEPRELLIQAIAMHPGQADHINKALQAHGAIHTKDGREISTTYSSCEQVLEAYSDPVMEDCRIRDSIDPAQLLAGNGTIYICAPSTEQEYLRPIFSALINDVLKEAYDTANIHGGALERPLLVMLDELANLARIPDLDTHASTCASHGICLVSVLQSYAQLVDKWGSSRAETIFDNHRAKVLLKGSTDRLLLDHFARLLGDEQVEQESTTMSEGRTSTTESTTFRPLAAIHELRRLPDNTGLLLCGNMPPTRLTLRPFYDDPVLSHLARPLDQAETKARLNA